MNDKDSVELVYDPLCPICEFYCRRIDVADTAGDLRHIDARRESETMNEITAAGLDIDQGMVLKHRGTLFYGSDAIHQLAVLSSRKGVLNRIAYSIFRHRRLAAFLYPFLAAGRNLLLKILRRSRVNNLGIEDNHRF